MSSKTKRGVMFQRSHRQNTYRAEQRSLLKTIAWKLQLVKRSSDSFSIVYPARPALVFISRRGVLFFSHGGVEALISWLSVDSLLMCERPLVSENYHSIFLKQSRFESWSNSDSSIAAVILWELYILSRLTTNYLLHCITLKETIETDISRSHV